VRGCDEPPAGVLAKPQAVSAVGATNWRSEIGPGTRVPHPKSFMTDVTVMWAPMTARRT